MLAMLLLGRVSQSHFHSLLFRVSHLEYTKFKTSISGPIPVEVNYFIFGWKGMNCVFPFGMASKVILHSFFWFLWLERNNRIFRDSSATTARVVYRIWLASGRWLKAFSLISQIEFEKWMRQLYAN
ncbi:hypothetical protein LINPERHAP1_LOCUS20706 [Linum perenne]